MQLQNHFLIAMPHLEDDHFYRSVVYLCEHNEQGAMGLVLTQPTDLSIAELCIKMNFMMADNRKYPDDLVLAGGPTNLERGFILHTESAKPFMNSHKVADNLWLTTSADVIDTLGTPQAPEKCLVALGCASWSPDQLEREIANNDWLVVPANEHILFDVPYLERWLAANQLLGIQQHNFAYQAGHC
ncbi:MULTISPECIES: YqgE/AlgH family protein [unclassified Avibacterium]|uniref:YqgE/AlgH family protein n=1 Tax=unclassified Avibacterium TaxID=2685287 RepID=UPI0020267F93|nr:MULTISPECIES: YqgE/AlgH family protein [unclassified Avibacterium]URL02166.1 YqgE/AlgH family protein [Avibacterium sp. 20-126]MCW9699902.1 YqgE/AlgH family protein [Avibacterium sp. 20-129]MCW9732778.1 YqgE/AlgH family protein [Avibacterium sp. 20-15]URL04919.1 YqgE/AlgH family protein [Avibacterium sp. 20-132]URL06523.1 YqgE/AlgH family protein [Avibacterium sp. 21-595]